MDALTSFFIDPKNDLLLAILAGLLHLKLEMARLCGRFDTHEKDRSDDYKSAVPPR